MKVDLKHVHTVKKKLADGSVKRYYRHRRTGKKIVGEPGSLEFHVSYEEACKAFELKNAVTFSNLITDFFASQKFKGLSARTRADYCAHRNIIEPEWGETPLAVFNDKRIKADIRRWRDKLADKMGARQSDLTLATTRRIVSFAVEDCTLEVNHLLGIAAIYEADRSDIIWLPEHVDAFWTLASPKMKLALILGLNLGRRMGDLIKLTWGDYTSEFMHVTNNKGGRKAKFPARVTEALRNSLDAYKRSLGRPAHRDETILTTETGKRWTEKHFTTKFSLEKNAAGLLDLHFHDLRGTAITVLAENGCTTAEIASISGHSMKHVDTILEKYMARTRALNDAATRKLEKSWVASFAIS
jgi:integrase